ncbi:DUF5722 domain-containing protein [Parablautia muri]|nr:DUF5722 domain-containing protein [Parablautia muri]
MRGSVEVANVEKKEEDASKDKTDKGKKTALSEGEKRRLTRGDLYVEAGELAGYASDFSLSYDAESEQMIYSLKMPQIPESDDAYLYLFALSCYENEETPGGYPAAFGPKGTECQISFSYEEEYLFQQFVPALLLEGKYVPVGDGIYLSNPEELADNQEEYPQLESKKGLLLDPTMLGTEELTDLGVKHAIYNIPLSAIMGETADETFPTITYTYQGTDYLFNGAAINGYDGLFTYLTDLGMCSTAIVLNDWNDDYIEMIHPQARDNTSGASYYMFNTAEEKGVKELEAVASFLAERYSDGKHGMVYSWVIANEINQFRTWNYMDTNDVTYYAQEFEKAFRIFYQAVKRRYAGAKVYFSIDHDWNSNKGDNRIYFNARDLIEGINQAALKHGNYDWGIAIHPYPNPLTRVNYWSQEYDKTQEAQTLSIMNLNVLTDFLGQEEYLDTKGKIRSITITELGFSSKFGQKLQAAAFAYCYYITEANPYVEAFIMNRQTDAPEEMVQGLSFGIYEYDHSEKFLKEIFCNIDTEQSEEYIDFMLNILGAGSLEEALSWAQ